MSGIQSRFIRNSKPLYYTTHDDPGTPALGVHAENWCPMPRRGGESRYLVVDAGPVFDDAGALIAVVETLRDFTESKQVQVRAEEQAVLLRHHYEEHQREAEMARRILDHQIRSDLTRQAGVHFAIMPATHFSGDLVLAARAPDGRLFAVLADATGHGLAAAVSVLPLVQEFYRLVAQGVSLAALVESIGFILGKSLPVGRFVAGAFVCLDGARGMGEIWCGGISDVYLLEEAGLRHFESRHVPMGVNPGDATQVDIESFVWRHPARLVMVSDGAAEASDTEGQAFGQERLLSVLLRQQEGDLIASVRAALDEHLDGAAAHDDISVVVIDCPAPL